MSGNENHIFWKMNGMQSNDWNGRKITTFWKYLIAKIHTNTTHSQYSKEKNAFEIELSTWCLVVGG